MARKRTKRERIVSDIMNAEKLNYSIRDIAVANTTTQKVVKEHLIDLKKKGVKIPSSLLVLFLCLIFTIQSFGQSIPGFYKIETMTGIETQVKEPEAYDYYIPKSTSTVRFDTNEEGRVMYLMIGKDYFTYQILEKKAVSGIEIKEHHSRTKNSLMFRDEDGQQVEGNWYMLRSLTDTSKTTNILQLIYRDNQGRPVMVYGFEAKK